MFDIKNNIIKITKGDSAAITVDLVDANGNPYAMQSGDKLYLTVRKRPSSPVLMQIDSTTNILDFTPNKTNKLEVGACCYDVQLTTKAGDVFTVIGLTDYMTSNMVVFGEVTQGV